MKNFSTRKLMQARSFCSRYLTWMNSYSTDSYSFRCYEANYKDCKQVYDNQLKALNELIDGGQSSAMARKIDAVMVINALVEIGNRLHMVRNNSLNGCTVTVDCNAQDFPSSYKYQPKSTLFDAVFESGAWTITNVYRGKTHRAKSRYILTMNKDTEQDILNHYRNFS